MKLVLALVSITALGSPALAQGLIVPITDTRSVSATSGADSESYTAAGFGVFNRTASAASSGPGGEFSDAFASMTSNILGDSIEIAGSASGNGSFGSSFCAESEALGTVTFEVTAACEFRFSGFVEAYDQGWSWATLKAQGSTNLLGGYIGLQFGVVPFDDAGYLQPGVYELYLSNYGGYCNDQYASMNYDVTLELTPFSGSDCSSSPNATGASAQLSARGTPSLGANDLVLEATAGPPGQFSMFLYGEAPSSTPLGNGTLCLGSPFVRLGAPELIDASGSRTLALDYGAAPFTTPQGMIQAGETWRFQWIFRDPVGAGLNLSDVLWVTFAP